MTDYPASSPSACTKSQQGRVFVPKREEKTNFIERLHPGYLLCIESFFQAKEDNPGASVYRRLSLGPRCVGQL
jgi:hypothetical protein